MKELSNILKFSNAFYFQYKQVMLKKQQITLLGYNSNLFGEGIWTWAQTLKIPLIEEEKLNPISLLVKRNLIRSCHSSKKMQTVALIFFILHSTLHYTGRRSREEDNVPFGDLRIASLLFADDVVLLASLDCDFQRAPGRFAAVKFCARNWWNVSSG